MQKLFSKIAAKPLPTIFVFFLVAIFCFAYGAKADAPTRYLAFQIFTGALDSSALRQSLPPPPGDLRKTVVDLGNRIGIQGVNGRRLGVVFGPISFDNSDEDARRMIDDGFNIALDTGVAVGFHIDDSMFWGRLKELNTAANIEWLDWKGTLNTGRRLDWSSEPKKIMPQLCINSKDVKAAVTKRTALLGEEIVKGRAKLHAAHKDDLFLGVIAGWETQIGRDFDTGKYLGYCALTNAGYSADNPPKDIDGARVKIVAEFIDFWSTALVKAGVPAEKVFSHIAFMSSTLYQMAQRANPAAVAGTYLQTVAFTPPATAFCAHCLPGFSTYPQPGHLEQWQEELNKHGNQHWASSEGTAVDPGAVDTPGAGMDMEGYLGNLFNHGAVVVNIFGWGIGDDGNPFRKIAESPNAMAAYQKFLRGEPLHEKPIPIPNIPPADLIDKIHTVQANLPTWVRQNGPAQVKDNLDRLDHAIKDKRFNDAAEAADALLKTMGK